MNPADVLVWLDEAVRPTAVRLLPVAVFIAVMLWEHRSPWRPIREPFIVRWLFNTGLFLANCLMIGGLTALPPPRWASAWTAAPAVHAATFSGLTIAALSGFLLLDLLLYFVHRIEHAVPMLWRLHSVHHSDAEVDVTTAVRHHPGEFMLNYALVALAVAAVGMPAGVVAAYGGIALAWQMLQHGNLRLHPVAERLARLGLVTPALHRTHHSLTRAEADTNFGTIFSLWDRLFGSYLALSETAGASLRHGVTQPDRPRNELLRWLLLMPPRAAAEPNPGQTGISPLNRTRPSPGR